MDPIRLIHEKTNLALKITNALGYKVPPPFLFGKSVVVDPELNKSDYNKEKFDAKYGKNFEGTLFLVPVRFVSSVVRRECFSVFRKQWHLLFRILLYLTVRCIWLQFCSAMFYPNQPLPRFHVLA